MADPWGVSVPAKSSGKLPVPNATPLRVTKETRQIVPKAPTYNPPPVRGQTHTPHGRSAVGGFVKQVGVDIKGDVRHPLRVVDASLGLLGGSRKQVKFAAQHPLANAQGKGPYSQQQTLIINGKPVRVNAATLPWFGGPKTEFESAATHGAAWGPHTPESPMEPGRGGPQNNADLIEHLKNNPEGATPAPLRPTVEMTEQQAHHRLAELDKQHEALLAKIAPSVNPYSAELAKAETLSRNTMRGRMAAGKKPSTGPAIEGRIGGGSKTIKTVGQDVRDLAETKLHEIIAKHPEHPVAQKAAALIAERDQLRAVLNARGEATIAGTPMPGLPHIPAPAGKGTPPLLPTERPGRAGTPQGQIFPRPMSAGRYPATAAHPRALFSSEAPSIPGTPLSPQGEVFPGRTPLPEAMGRANPPPGVTPRLQPGMETPETGGQLGRQVREGLRGAKAARKQQDILYSAERGKRAGEFAQRLQQDPTMAGYRAATGALKGELPKLHFAGFEKLDQNALDALVKHVADHPLLRPFEKAGTIDALAKISGGKVPTGGQIKLLRQVFGRETSADLVHSVSTWQQWKMRGLDVLNIPRSIMASFDVSAPFRQGLVVAVTHPAIFSKNLAPMFKSLGSERFYQDTLAQIHARPTYPAMEKAGVAFTELGQNLTHREEQFVSNMAESIPGLGHVVRASGRAYTGFLDKTRADVFDTLLAKAVQSGHDGNDQKLIEGIAGFVNSATGRGSLGALQDHAVTLNTLMFSPRLLASRLNFMNPVWYARLDPFARKEAMKAAVSLVATMGLVMYVAKLAGAKVGDDPRSADFAKIKIGDTRIDLAGGFQQPVRLIAQLGTGQTISTTTGNVLNLGAAGPGKVSRFDIGARFLRSKSAPVPGAIWDLATQQTFAGQPLTWKNTLVPRVTPLAAQDAYDTGTNWKSIPAGIGAYGLSALGVGVQTYKARQPKSKGAVDPWNVNNTGGSSDPWSVSP